MIAVVDHLDCNGKSILWPWKQFKKQSGSIFSSQILLVSFWWFVCGSAAERSSSKQISPQQFQTPQKFLIFIIYGVEKKSYVLNSLKSEGVFVNKKK